MKNKRHLPNLLLVSGCLLAVLTLAVPCSAQPAPPVFEGCSPPPPDLVAWWTFDHLDGAALAVDAVGVHSGTVSGDRDFVAGQLGNALFFDGSGDVVEVDDSPLLDFGAVTDDDFSIDFWIRSNAIGLSAVLDKRDPATGHGWQVFLLHDGTIGLQLNDEEKGFFNFVGPQVGDGEWHFIAITVDRDDPDGGVFYLDGVQVGDTFRPTRRTASVSNDAPLLIGGAEFDGPLAFSGTLDEIEIFRRALTADEVARLYESGVNRLGKCTFQIQVPWDTSYCLGIPSRVDLTLCNNSTSDDAYDLDFASLPAGSQVHPRYGCTLDGPTTFQLPPGVAEPVVVPAGSCLTVPVEVGGVVIPDPIDGNIACFQTTATSVLSGDSIQRPGSLYFTGSVCCDRGSPRRSEVPLDGGGRVEFDATNVSDQPQTFQYELSVVGPDMERDESAVALDGLEPGQSVTGEVEIAPGDTASIPVDVAFERFTGLGFYEVLLADRSRAEPNALASQAIRPVAGDCDRSDVTLCLNRDRFRVEVEWTDFQGNDGSGIAVPLTSDTGYFWFFRDTNVELVVKVLDARPVNGNFWVFYGALSNVAYTITVTDTETGDSKTYVNPAGQFASVGDTAAFPQGAAAAGLPRHRVADAAEVGDTTPLAHDPFAFADAPGDAGAQRVTAAQGTCTEQDAGDLCLTDERFRLEVRWTDFQGNQGEGTAVPLTGDTGYFWFFRDTNVELIVKVLDGRPINGNFWVFYGALSNVAYELTVTDTATGDSKTYVNPSGNFASQGDTEAFGGGS